MGDTMTDWELDVLRIMNGEHIEGAVAGAAMWDAASWLKSHGYAQGHYEITDKGRAYLAKLGGISSESVS